MSLPPCVLVAGTSVGSVLHAARGVTAAGAPAVHVAAAPGAGWVYRRSRWCASARDLGAAPGADLGREVVEWASQVAGGGEVVVIPLADRLVESLHRVREDVPGALRLSIPPAGATEVLLDKARATEAAEAAGLDVLPWTEVSLPADLPRAARIPLPVVVRPSTWATGGARRFKLAVARGEGERDALLARLVAERARVVVQQQVRAPDDAVELALLWRSADGTRTATCTARKRRQAHPDGGVMVWGETVDRPDVAADALRLAEATGFTGAGGLEVIRDGARRWFIELNPRAEAIHFLGARAGVDTVALAYLDAAGATPAPAPTAAPATTAWVGSAALERLGAPGGVRTVARERLAFQRAPRRVRAVWAWDDPGPGLAVGAAVVGGRARRAAGSLLGRARPAT